MSVFLAIPFVLVQGVKIDLAEQIDNPNLSSPRDGSLSCLGDLRFPCRIIRKAALVKRPAADLLLEDDCGPVV